MLEIFKILGTIAISNSEANDAISETTEKAGSFSETLKSGIGTAAKWGTAIVAGAGTAAVGISAFASKSASAADNIDKMSQKIGISRDAYQELDFICSQSGTSVDNLQAGMKSLVSAMDGAASGTKSNIEQFEKLGISVTDANGNLRSSEDVMWETMSALQSMDNETEKARLATELFGRSGTELMPLLNGASGSIDEMKQQAHDLGLVLDDETIDAGVKLTDTMDQLKRSFSAIITRIGAKLMPLVQKFSQYIIDNLPTIQAEIDKLEPVLTKIFNKTSKFLLAIAPKLLTVIKGLISAISVAIDVISSIVGWLKEHETATVLIATAIGTLTAAIIAYNIAMNAAAIATAVVTAATTAFGAVMAFVTSPITAVIVAIGLLVAAIYLLCKNWDDVKELGIICWEGIKGAFEKAGEWFNTTVVEPIKNFFTDLWDKLKTSASDAWEGIKDVFSSVASFFENTFKTAWEAVKAVFSTGGKIFDGIKEGIADTFKTIVNGLITGINKVINVPFSAINGMLNKIRSVGVAGVHPFKSLWDKNPISIPEIPQLYEGGVLEKGQTGYLEGNGAEAVVPLEKNTKWINRVADQMESAQGGNVTELLQAILQAIITLDNNMGGNLADALNQSSLKLNDRELIKIVTNGISRQQANVTRVGGAYV